MFRQFLARFCRKAPRNEGGATDESSVDAPSAGFPSAGAAPLADPAAPPPGIPLPQVLRDWIVDRSRWLRDWPGCGSNNRDCNALLDSLVSQSGVTIRQPPLAARRLLQQARRQTASYARMAETIRTDPSLVQGILRHANSVHYGGTAGSGPIVSLPPALQRLGTTGIEIVVMSHLVEGALCRPGGGLDRLAGEVWAHMVRTAPLARELAPAMQVHPDEAYALGLLHDVGKLVVFNRIADLRKQLRRPIRRPDGFVRAALRELHAPLGALAILEWGMGEEAALAVAHHHRNPPPPHPCPGSELLFLAERLDWLESAGEEPDFGALRDEGALTVDRAGVEAWWAARMEAETPEPEEKPASAA